MQVVLIRHYASYRVRLNGGSEGLTMITSLDRAISSPTWADIVRRAPSRMWISGLAAKFLSAKNPPKKHSASRNVSRIFSAEYQLEK